MTLNDYLAGVGISFGQTMLVVGGLFGLFIFPMISPPITSATGFQLGPIVMYASLAALVGGVGWWIYSAGGKKSAATFAHPGGFYDPVVPQSYPNPRNNFSDVKPRNRFDLQTNYILNEQNSTFDNYVNDIILSESKKAGINILDKNNYPVKLEPYQLKTLNPTTAMTPIRDFNTVKMIA